MAIVQELLSNAVLGLKDEALSASITLVIAMLMWFVVLPLCSKSQPKKYVGEEGHQPADQASYKPCLKQTHYIAQSRVVKGISGILVLVMLARILKMAGAFEHPLVILPISFLLGGLVRFWSSSSHEHDAVEYPENDKDEDMIGDDACHHSEAFWSKIGQAQEKTEMPSLSPSEILSDVLLPLLSDKAVAPIFKAGTSRSLLYRDSSLAPEGKNSPPAVACSTCCCITSTAVLLVSLALFHYARVSSRPLLVLPLAFLLGGLLRWVMSPCSSDICEEIVDYPESQPEELCDNDMCHHTAAFWSELGPTEAKASDVTLQSSEILSDVLLGYLNDPVVSSIFITQ